MINVNELPNRSLNVHHLEPYLDPLDGKRKMMAVPFPCDVCRAEHACYGIDGALLCGDCWLRRKGQA